VSASRNPRVVKGATFAAIGLALMFLKVRMATAVEESDFSSVANFVCGVLGPMFALIGGYLLLMREKPPGSE